MRTTRRAIERLMELITECQPLEEVYLVHTSAPDKLEILRERAKPLFPSKTNCSLCRSPLSSAHTSGLAPTASPLSPVAPIPANRTP